MKKDSLSILFPCQDQVEYRLLPDETWHDLGLDLLTEKIAAKPQEVPLLKRVMSSLSANPSVSRFRIDVFDDLYHLPDVRKQMAVLLDKVKMFYDYGVVNRHEGSDPGIWDLMHRLEEYHEYIQTVESLLDCLRNADIRSEGLVRLREQVAEIHQANGFADLKRDVEEMRVAASDVKSVTVGINLNDRFEAVGMGLVSVNAKPFTRSGLLRNFVTAVLPRDDIHPEADWNGSMSFHPASDKLPLLAGAESLMKTQMMIRNPLIGFSMAAIPPDDGTAHVPREMDSSASLLLSRLVRRLRDMLARYVNVSVKEISDLIPELVFYTRWAEYIELQEKKGWRFCKPEVAGSHAGFSSMDAADFYNLKLISTEKPDSVTPNSLCFDHEKRVYVLTGANRGGKTTLTQAVGQLFLLAQSGIRVPAVSFLFDPADLVLTHFPADEDKTMDLGRLGEECSRFRTLYTLCTSDTLLLLNESFSTTSFEEGYYIAVDAVRAILDKNCRTIYNTHMHKLAYDLDSTVNRNSEGRKAVSLIVETRNGRHSFRVRIAPPEGKSFAREIAEKYGVTYERLTLSGNPADHASETQ